MTVKCESDWCWRFGYPPTDRVTNRSLHVDHHRPGLFTHPETPSIYWYNLIVSKSAADVCYMSTLTRRFLHRLWNLFATAYLISQVTNSPGIGYLSTVAVHHELPTQLWL